jgi:hypothetical protein
MQFLTSLNKQQAQGNLKLSDGGHLTKKKIIN